MTVKKHMRAVLGVLVAAAGLAAVPASSSAAAGSPWWNLNTSIRPATISDGEEGTLVLQALNVGDGSTVGPASLGLTLPPGLAIKTNKKGIPEIHFFGPLRSSFSLGFDFGPTGSLGSLGLCDVAGNRLSCTTEAPTTPGYVSQALTQVAPFEQLEVRVGVRDEGATSGAVVGGEVSGGGAAAVSSERRLQIGQAPSFGAEALSVYPEEEGGQVDTRAGSHPFQLTTTFNLNQTADIGHPPAMARNLEFELPPGQLGNVTVTPQCSALQFSTEVSGGANLCPSDTALGVASITFFEPENVGLATYPTPVFNLTPKFGEPARFGFVVLGNPVILDTSIRSGSGEDYGVTVSSKNISQLVNFIASTLTFWGTPSDPRHDESRGWGCIASGHYSSEGTVTCAPSTKAKPPAFLTLPTDCAAPFASAVQGESWSDPTHPVAAKFPPFSYSLEEAGTPLSLIGCNQVPFAPTIHAEPTSNAATSPTGLAFDMYVDDEGLIANDGLAQSQLAKAIVSLPVGMTTNPSVAAGLSACSSAEYDSEDVASTPGTGCTPESKIGTVEIESPLVTQKIEGSVYLAKQDENPFKSLIALYVVAKNPELGVMIRVAGKVEPDSVTGQLVTTFEGIPELPFSHFHFAFRQGQRAPLATPAACGTYTTTADLTPHSNPAEALHETATFTITTGPEGAPCPSGGTPPFNPAVTAGTANNAAASYSPMYIQVTRKDTEQEITRFSAQLPQGLTANLSGVPFCPDTDIALAKTMSGASEEAQPSCPAASQIGHTAVGVGVGGVLAWSSGRLYLAGPYNGAPFSVVAVNSAKVGPFDLGTVVVREALAIDPETAVVTVDAKASDPIPHILDGIVIHARDIRVYVDRPDFSLNPTSCNPMTFSATVDGAGADPANPADQQPVTTGDHFQAADCANLAFKPAFKASTSGKTSRKNGASLHVMLTYPTDALGKDANIKTVKVDLPKQLPSRLTTLQKACTAAQFAANPAGCPPASMIGHAKAITPLIPVPLEGPAYFVSHGGEQFPDLIMVLQGYGVTIDLVGSTFINKAGITSSTFKTVPDQPVGSFELTLPQGKYSALAANGNLCNTKLAMPTEFVAQNGAQIHQTTKITVTGCAKTHKKTNKHTTKHKRHKKG